MLERVKAPEAIKKEIRNILALNLLEERGALETNGHFDYGNGYHGSVYLHFHKLLEVPYNIWQLAGDLLERIDSGTKHETQVVSGPVMGGAILGAVLATLIDSGSSDNKKWTPDHELVRFAPLHRSREQLDLKQHYRGVVKGKKVLLVDDVRNTGRTFADAYRLLADAGAEIIATAELYDYNDPLADLAVPNFPGAKFPHKGTREQASMCHLCKLGFPIRRF